MRRNKVVGCLGLTAAMPWIATIAYLFYLGFSTGDWLSDKFLKWEDISFIFLLPFLVGGTIAGVNLICGDSHE